MHTTKEAQRRYLRKLQAAALRRADRNQRTAAQHAAAAAEIERQLRAEAAPPEDFENRTSAALQYLADEYDYQQGDPDRYKHEEQ